LSVASPELPKASDNWQLATGNLFLHNAGGSAGEKEKDAMQTNATLVSSIQDDDASAREKAKADLAKAKDIYFAILKDPARTSDKDKTLIAAAMKLLGKTPSDAACDADAIERAHALAKAAQAGWALRDELQKAGEDELEFHTKTKLEMQKRIGELIHEKRNAIKAIENRMDEATRARYAAGAIGLKNPHLLEHLPAEAQTPIVPRIGGEKYDPLNIDPSGRIWRGE
jgi:hypothetical protein